ncbi:MAG: hypothetical protein LBV78_16755, partial [Kitasatospora sp.]|nr:hypothetical protein [Kitasatospora sp.]
PGPDPHEPARRGLRAAAPALTELCDRPLLAEAGLLAAPAARQPRAAATALTDLRDRPLLGEAGLLAVPAVRKTLAAATDPAQTAPPGTLAALADLVATELWLRRLAARRPGSSWTGLPAPRRTALET